MSASQLVLAISLDDGERQLTVTTRLSDHNLWDITRAKHHWPKPDEAPMTWLGFLAWAAARRTGQLEPGTTWESFLESADGVENVTDDEEAADPTRPGPGPG